ncbi:MAG: 30S ribosomal protein S17 [Gammaproteobacteria bacterium]|nr:30S ribosomal protein S17 [Gammaproteobacteria bacterium]MYD77218.1 30S ribosomal protein S17 [Gammaproteobacteria bacterium]MYJ52309.1 30S ribosomal protein S17 [Gammaproteobacteria bacterium]
MWSEDKPASVAEASPPEAKEPVAAEVVSEQQAPAKRSVGKEEKKTAGEKAVTAPAKRRIRGSVVSKSGNKSIVVLVQRKVKHPLYKKYIKRSTKLHAHDERNESAVGDVVRIESCRPVSKTKCWRLVEVVSHVQ